MPYKCERCLDRLDRTPLTEDKYHWAAVRLAESNLLHIVVKTPQTHLLCMMTQEGSNA